MDKAARIGIRIADLLDRDFSKKSWNEIWKRKTALLEQVYEAEGFNDAMLTNTVNTANRCGHM